MTTPDGRYTIVFNGEIYNFRELRSRELAGIPLRTHSDTEVLLELFARDGEACLPLLNGMFAFAIWDAEKECLTVARDRFGKKPLYYAETGTEIIIGSEPKALLAHPSVSRDLDHAALVKYLLFEYVPSPWTPFRSLRKLPRGHVLTADRTGIRSRPWTAAPAVVRSVSRDAKTLLRTADELLGAAVRRRLIADVPVGLFLSGGIDSSTIGWYMCRYQSNTHSFSIRFSEPSFDESSHAREVAHYLGTKHTEIPFGRAEFEDTVQWIQPLLDEPLADASLIPTSVLARRCREDITVALTGDGGDELLFGYNTFLAHELGLIYERVPRPLRALIAELVRFLPTRYSNISPDYQAKRFVTGMQYPWHIRNQVWLGSFAAHELRDLLSPEFRPLLRTLHEDIDRALRALPADLPSLEKLLFVYQEQYLQDDLLVKTDRATMYASLEARCPFLDPDFAAFALSLPRAWRYRHGQGKTLLKELMRDRIPANVLSRKKKGFGIPLGFWMRDWFRPTVEATLAPDRLAAHGFFRAPAVQRLITEHMHGRADHRKKLWTLMVLQWWWERWH